MSGKETNSIDVCFTFDTTGSMYPCLTQVRRSISKTIERLCKDIPDLRIAIIAHGDYCDKNHPYVTKIMDFTRDEDKICNFVNSVEATGGGDSPECYELVLHESRSLSWKSGRSKVVVMIGDDVPHAATYPDNTKKIDWRNELGLLTEAGINVYGVHCMPGCRAHSKSFYTAIAEKTGGFYITLDQFSTVTDMIMAVCYKQDGTKLDDFEKEVKAGGRMNRNMSVIFGTLTGKKYVVESKGRGDLNPVPAGRFQVLKVDKVQDIAGFVRDQGVTFKKGRGFYELTKAEKVQGYKEIVLMDRASGDIFNGDKVREMLGLPPQSGKDGYEREDVKLKPVDLDKYHVFIQSTSVNRKLMENTRLLYEVEDWEK